MAKDKNFEKLYKEERLRRKIIRKSKRTERRRLNHYKYKRKICPDCGGYMTWCDCCQMWSQDCCEEYGTCMCS